MDLNTDVGNNKFNVLRRCPLWNRSAFIYLYTTSADYFRTAFLDSINEPSEPQVIGKQTLPFTGTHRQSAIISVC